MIDQSIQKFWQVADSRYSRNRQRSVATVTSVSRDSYGQSVNAKASVDGAGDVPIAISYGQKLSSGSRVEIENIGSPTNPQWQLARSLVPLAPPPKLVEVWEDTDYEYPSGPVTYGAGDLIAGDVVSGIGNNLYYNAATGSLMLRKGDQPRIVLDGAWGSVRLGRRENGFPNLVYNAETGSLSLSVVSGTDDISYIRLDQTGGYIDGKLIVTKHLSNQTNGTPLTGSGFWLGVDSDNKAKLRVGEMIGNIVDSKVAEKHFLYFSEEDGQLHISANYYQNGGDLLVGLGPNAVNDTHIDWGIGPNQVNALDLPLGTSLQTSAGTNILIADGANSVDAALAAIMARRIQGDLAKGVVVNAASNYLRDNPTISLGAALDISINPATAKFDAAGGHGHYLESVDDATITLNKGKVLRSTSAGALSLTGIDLEPPSISKGMTITLENNHSTFALQVLKKNALGEPERMFEVTESGRLQSGNYTSDVSGWAAYPNGHLELQSALIRGELAASVFTYKSLSVVDGSIAVTRAAQVGKPNPSWSSTPPAWAAGKTINVLPSDNSYSGASPAASFWLVLKNNEITGGADNLAIGDVLLVKPFVRPASGQKLNIYEVFLEVMSQSGQAYVAISDTVSEDNRTGLSRVLVTRRKGGAAGLVIQDNLPAIRWGHVGSGPSYVGGIYLTGDGLESTSDWPYIDIRTAPYTSTPWTQTQTVNVRQGNLSGLGIGFSGEWGIAAGSSLNSTSLSRASYIVASDKGVRLNNADILMQKNGIVTGQFLSAGILKLGKDLSRHAPLFTFDPTLTSTGRLLIGELKDDGSYFLYENGVAAFAGNGAGVTNISGNHIETGTILLKNTGTGGVGIDIDTNGKIHFLQGGILKMDSGGSLEVGEIANTNEGYLKFDPVTKKLTIRGEIEVTNDLGYITPGSVITSVDLFFDSSVVGGNVYVYGSDGALGACAQIRTASGGWFRLYASEQISSGDSRNFVLVMDKDALSSAPNVNGDGYAGYIYDKTWWDSTGRFSASLTAIAFGEVSFTELVSAIPAYAGGTIIGPGYIKTGAIQAQHISSNTIQAQHLAVGAIEAQHLSADAINAVSITADSKVTVGTGNNVAILDGQDAEWRFYVGHSSPVSAPFRVRQDGYMQATNANIQGHVDAASGTLGALSVSGELSVQSTGSLKWYGNVGQFSGFIDQYGMYLKEVATDSVFRIGRPGRTALVDAEMSVLGASQWSHAYRAKDGGNTLKTVSSLFYGESKVGYGQVPVGELDVVSDAIDRIFWAKTESTETNPGRASISNGADGFYAQMAGGTQYGSPNDSSFWNTKGVGLKVEVAGVAPGIMINKTNGFTSQPAIWITGSGPGTSHVRVVAGDWNQTAIAIVPGGWSPVALDTGGARIEMGGGWINSARVSITGGGSDIGLHFSGGNAADDNYNDLTLRMGSGSFAYRTIRKWIRVKIDGTEYMIPAVSSIF